MEKRNAAMDTHGHEEEDDHGHEEEGHVDDVSEGECCSHCSVAMLPP